MTLVVVQAREGVMALRQRDTLTGRTPLLRAAAARSASRTAVPGPSGSMTSTPSEAKKTAICSCAANVAAFAAARTSGGSGEKGGGGCGLMMGP